MKHRGMFKLIISISFILFFLSSLSIRASDMKYELTTFAGGCFWCMEASFEQLKGIFKVTSGYAGGKKSNSTYQFVSSGKSGYVEAIQIEYDPQLVSYKELLKFYWQQIDPTDAGGQFTNRGGKRI